MSDIEREQFEAWLLAERGAAFHDFHGFSSGDPATFLWSYSDHSVNAVWLGYCRGLAARSQSPDHIADASKMVKGDVSTAGSVILLEGKTYERAVVVAFDSDDDLRAAIDAGQCRFTVFGGEV